MTLKEEDNESLICFEQPNKIQIVMRGSNLSHLEECIIEEINRTIKSFSNLHWKTVNLCPRCVQIAGVYHELIAMNDRMKCKVEHQSMKNT